MTARVGVFIDGQNITIGARYAFDRDEGRAGGNMHPLLLGRLLAGDDELVEIRYATGIPDANIDPKRAEAETRRHDLMRQTDVVVLERTLRYRWEWEIQDRDLPDARDHREDVRQARVKSRQRGQEKGIDVWLALDALVMCTRADVDRVIIASADSDLDIVPQQLKRIEGHKDTEVVSAKVVPKGKSLRTNDAYDATMAIDREIFEAAEDHFDYTKPLDRGEVASFLAKIGSGADGIRD